jgi:putative nucleotidyltransferase with HDIG domain
VAQRGLGQYSSFVTEAGTNIAVLLERSPAASDVDEDAREAIEYAVSELVDALRNHHTGTADHSNRLAVDCRAVADELGLDPATAVETELVAILHDIGKLAVPASILDLPRPLNGRERGLVQSHAVRGAEMLTDIAGLRHLAPFVRASHERWDGTGYPDGLTGEQIPLAARIVSTVDAFDAMTNDRPYRRALDRGEARRRMWGGAGSAFDPRVVRALLESIG